MEHSADPPRKVHHLTFASDDYTVPAWMLGRSARRYGMTSRVFGPDDPVVAKLRQEHPDIMSHRRGAGYWLWKPFIIREALRQADDGDLVVYTDAGMIISDDPRPFLRHCAQRPVTLFRLDADKRIVAWTHRECLLALGADTPEIWPRIQLMSGVQVYRAGPQARSFIDDFCRAVQIPGVMVDEPAPPRAKQHSAFREHRHDQSVLSILACQGELDTFPDPTQFGPWSDDGALDDRERDDRESVPYRQTFFLHRFRNRAARKWAWRLVLTGHRI